MSRCTNPGPVHILGVEDVCWPLWGAFKGPCSILSMLSWLLGTAGFNQGASSPSGQAHPLVSCRKQSILSAVPCCRPPQAQSSLCTCTLPGSSHPGRSLTRRSAWRVRSCSQAAPL